MKTYTVNRTPAEPAYDIMNGSSRIEINVDGQSGTVALLDIMPRLCPLDCTADHAIVQAARVSYGDGTKTVEEDVGLVRYLLRHMHTTPFEMVEFKFHCVMPIFVARQWIRHRTANVNEYSSRYSVVKDRFFQFNPKDVRAASNKNKQVSEGHVSEMTAKEFSEWLEDTSYHSYRDYERYVGKGVGREIARCGLPVNVYTEWYWKIDLHNLLHFLGLRMHEHAQKEIRDYADAMYQLIQPMVPVAAKAFMDYHHHMGGMKLSALDIEAIKSGSVDVFQNKREREEFEKKKERLGL